MRWVQLNRRWLYVAATGVLSCGLAILTVWGDKTSPVMATIGYSWLAACYAMALLHTVTASAGFVSRLLRWPPLMKLGTISYCIYLFHPLFVEGTRRFVHPYVNPVIGLGCQPEFWE